jgi:BMFP domain-containing protein YqiC
MNRKLIPLPPSALQSVAADLSEKLRALDDAINAAYEAVKRRESDVVNELEPWLDKRSAARFLAMSISTLETRLASRTPPPHTHDGGKLRFKPSELDTWLRQWTVHKGRR